MSLRQIPQMSQIQICMPQVHSQHIRPPLGVFLLPSWLFMGPVLFVTIPRWNQPYCFQ